MFGFSNDAIYKFINKDTMLVLKKVAKNQKIVKTLFLVLINKRFLFRSELISNRKKCSSVFKNLCPEAIAPFP